MRRLLLLILLVPILVIAQSDNMLIIGETITLTVSADARATINFTIEDDFETITIQAQAMAEEFDAVIWLVDEHHHLLAYNDNFEADSTARIENLLLKAGTYTLVVDSFNGVSDGDVALTVETANPFEISLSQDDNTTIIIAKLPEDTIFRHWVELSHGESVSITVRDTSGTLDPYLILMDSDGVILAANDDHQLADTALNRLDSRINAWDVPNDGMYLIEIRDFLGNVGQFELVITTLP